MPYVLLAALVQVRTDADLRAMMAPPLDPTAAAMSMASKMREAAGDDDMQVEVETIPVTCPLTAARICVPARFTDAPSIACFDLHAFLEQVRQTRKWRCPITDVDSDVRKLQVDTGMGIILQHLRHQPEVQRVQVRVDGSWRPVPGGAGQVEPWRPIVAPAPEDAPVLPPMFFGSRLPPDAPMEDQHRPPPRAPVQAADDSGAFDVDQWLA